MIDKVDGLKVHLVSLINHVNYPLLFIPMFKIILIALLLVIIASLFSALYFLLKDPGSSTRVVKMLAVRVGLSLFVMGLLFIGSWLGWVQPHGFGG